MSNIKCCYCYDTFKNSDCLGRTKCWPVADTHTHSHYHCLVVAILNGDGCYSTHEKKCTQEDIQVYSLTPKSPESHACLEEIKLIKTELAKLSEIASKQERQHELVAQLKLSVKELSDDNNRRFNELRAQLELSSQDTCNLQKRLNDREQTIESLSKEIAQLKQCSHKTPNTGELYKRLEDYEVTIESLKQDIAQLKLNSSINSGSTQCSKDIEKTAVSLVKSNEQTSTQQESLLCRCNSAEQSLMKVDTRSKLNSTLKNSLYLQKENDESGKQDQSSNEPKINLEENENKCFLQLEAQLAQSNKNLMELQKLMNDIKTNLNNAKIPSQSANENTRENTVNNQYMFQDLKILLQNSSDMGNNTTGSNNKWPHKDEPQCVAEAKNIIAMKDRIIQELLQKLKDKSWELTVEQMKLQRYLFDENLPKNACN